MAILWVITGVLFVYSVYSTISYWKRETEIHKSIGGILNVAGGTEDEPPYIFMEINTSPEQLREGDIVHFSVHKIQPRN